MAQYAGGYMRRTGIYVIGLPFLFSAGLLNTVEAHQERDDAGNKMDPSVRRLISEVDPEQMSKNLFYLAKDPLPYRKLNLTLPGHEKNTLYEADDYLAGKLETLGYRVEREGVRVQAFRRDASKPKHAQYSPPKPEDPWYMAYNLYAEDHPSARSQGFAELDRLPRGQRQCDWNRWCAGDGSHPRRVPLRTHYPVSLLQ